MFCICHVGNTDNRGNFKFKRSISYALVTLYLCMVIIWKTYVYNKQDVVAYEKRVEPCWTNNIKLYDSIIFLHSIFSTKLVVGKRKSSWTEVNLFSRSYHNIEIFLPHTSLLFWESLQSVRQ